MVDRIRIGSHGYTLVVAPNGTLLAHGDSDKKVLVAQSRTMKGHPLVAAVRDERDDAPASEEYVDKDGRSDLGVASRVPSLGWTVVVEQPRSEAYASAIVLQRQFVLAISLVLLTMGRIFIWTLLHRPDS